ncbi:DNA polymerase delta subunit 3 isoform X1 [Synchiropus splendidus]|uniref:DNA polymerase delta subunit 3 isoform X1 n=1 Tax=Synchiropus splendidus TaxID=270530 RepID=UPI00237E5610|nr:DNA polymerase delta subunit 3 isoform X1 [Synchiropus splendidus]
MDMDELYLDNIDEYVNDHDKIVTYKWLSLTLGVHVNTAKQMLFHYLDHKRKESSAQLHATYLVSGKLVDNGHTSHKVSVVREDQLEDIKSKLSPVVSVHVYSVQKALLKDSGPLYSVDYDAVKDNMKTCSKYSAIRCSTAVPLSPVELQQAREIHRAPTPEPEVKKSSVNGNTASKISSKPQKGIMGMFANKPGPKNQDGTTDIKSEVKDNAPTIEASKPAAKTNHMNNFFGNQTKKPVKEEETAASPAAEEKPQEEQPTKKQEATAVEPPKQTKKDSRSKSKRVKDSDSEDEKMEKKKRRRIKKPEPDSSDEDVIPDSPQPMETRGTSPSPKKQIKPVLQSNETSEGKIRRRRRVLKSRTFVDDEGCIVTEKGYESESYSEDDTPAPEPAAKAAAPSRPQTGSKDSEKKSQKKSAANKGSKQASIMGFFQKK